MGIAASLLFYTAAAAPAPQPAAQEARQAPVSSSAIAVQARATIRIMPGAKVRFDREAQSARVNSEAQPQIKRDSSDILWVEFS